MPLKGQTDDGGKTHTSPPGLASGEVGQAVGKGDGRAHHVTKYEV